MLKRQLPSSFLNTNFSVFLMRKCFLFYLYKLFMNVQVNVGIDNSHTRDVPPFPAASESKVRKLCSF